MSVRPDAIIKLNDLNLMKKKRELLKQLGMGGGKEGFLDKSSWILSECVARLLFGLSTNLLSVHIGSHFHVLTPAKKKDKKTLKLVTRAI